MGGDRRIGGVRVLVGDFRRRERERGYVVASYGDSGPWKGNDIRDVCPEPPTGEECETIRCDNWMTCLERFVLVDPSIAVGIGTAVVDCGNKQGRYVTIELPGITADSPSIEQPHLFDHPVHVVL